MTSSTVTKSPKSESETRKRESGVLLPTFKTSRDKDDFKNYSGSCRSEAPSVTLETDLTSCPVCLIGEPKEINRSTKSKIIVYTRDGTLLAEHKEKRCNNRNCRVGAYYGYIVIRGGDRIYLPNCLNIEFLVVSSQTAFHINYLLEVVTDLHLLQVGRNS